MTAPGKEWQFEVAVVGGGPGGASAATTLAQRGRSVVVLEKERFPRFHIGESQLPWSNDVFEALGVRETIASAGFVQKWGASFRTLDGRAERYADFAAAVETPMPQTFQVRRAEFDDLLLRHAAKSGADVREGHRVLEATFDTDGVTLRIERADGHAPTLRVAAVVDASGRTALITKRMGRHEKDPLLRNIAVYAHYEGIPRASGRRGGDIRMLTRRDMGWIWLIPISDAVTSVGAVVPQGVHALEAKATPEKSLLHYLATTVGGPPLMKEARRISPARFEADYSYLGTRLSGDRWVAVGDAAGFLDPIFSTGVLLAMQAGIDAATALDRGLADGDLGASRFSAYERKVRRRYHHFRRFAIGFYDPAFRDLWFTPSSRFGLYEAVLSVLAGNWRPSLATRLRIAVFFLLVRLQRHLPLAPRVAQTIASGETP